MVLKKLKIWLPRNHFQYLVKKYNKIFVKTLRTKILLEIFKIYKSFEISSVVFLLAVVNESVSLKTGKLIEMLDQSSVVVVSLVLYTRPNGVD